MKSPAFQWYAADYLADERVMLLSLESEAAYVRLLNYCWREGSIPANAALCAPMCKYADVKVIKPALALFTKSPVQAGRLIHKRLEEERAKQAEYRAKQSAKGKAGGRPRKADDKPDESHGKATALPQLNHGLTEGDLNESSLSTSSTSSTTEDKEKLASSAGQDLASPVESLTPEQRPAPRAPKLYRYDNAPVFIISEFFDYLRAQAYGHVDMGMYLQRITEHIKRRLHAPALGEKKLKPEATNDEWKAFILNWLDRDKAQKKLLLPDAAPVVGGYQGPNPALQIVPTTTTNYGAGRMAAQAENLYL